MREVQEETELTQVCLRAQLVTVDQPHPLTGQSRSTTFFAMDVNAAPPTRGSIWFAEATPTMD